MCVCVLCVCVCVCVSAHIKRGQNKAENEPITWIDSMNAYYIVAQTWIKECLKMWKTSNKILNSVTKQLKTLEWNWRREAEP